MNQEMNKKMRDCLIFLGKIVLYYFILLIVKLS